MGVVSGYFAGPPWAQSLFLSYVTRFINKYPLKPECRSLFFKKDVYIYPRKVLKQDDFRPGTKKGKLDQMPVWIVQVRMPKELIRTIYSGYEIEQDYNQEPANSEVVDDATPIEKADSIEPEGI